MGPCQSSARPYLKNRIRLARVSHSSEELRRNRGAPNGALRQVCSVLQSLLWKAFPGRACPVTPVENTPVPRVGNSHSNVRLWKTSPTTRAFSRLAPRAPSYNESGWETGGTICAVARCAATWPACCRNFANATRQTPYATRTPKASDASAAQINISIFTASCISRIFSSVLPRVLHRLRLDALTRRSDALSFHLIRNRTPTR